MSHPDHPAPPVWRLALVLGALTAFTPLAVDMYLPALPEMQRAMGAGEGQMQLSLSLFFLGLSVGQFLIGPLSDRFGRLRPLYAGTAVYIAASLACMWATQAESLIALRFVQALGCCAGMVISRAMVRDLFPPQDVARIFSMLMLVLGVAPILAPLGGGYLLLWFGWPSIFLFLAVSGSLVVLVAARALPETHHGPYSSLNALVVLRAYGGLLADRRFMAFTLASSLPSAGMFAYIAGSPFIFISLYGLSPQAYGWIFGNNAVGIIGLSQVNRWLLQYYTSPKLLVLAGRFQVAAALGLLLVGLTGFGGAYGLAAMLFLTVSPQGLIMPNGGAAAMAHIGARIGTASALMGLLQFGGGGLSSALVGLFSDGTPMPTVAIIAACMAGGYAARYLLVSDRA